MGLTPPLLKSCLPSVDQDHPQPARKLVRTLARPPVFVVSDSLFSARSLSFSSLLSRHTTILSTPVELAGAHQIARTNAAFPVTLAGQLPRCTLTELSQSLGGCDLPCGLHGSLSTLRRGGSALRAHPQMARSFVGNAVPSATFKDLAHINERLDNYSWLGF